MKEHRGLVHGPVYLVGSGGDLLARVARRAYEALGKKNARVAVTYAPVAGDETGLKFMSERMATLFPDALVERFALHGEEGEMPAGTARAVVDQADLVFVSGGDPTLGAVLLERTGAADWLRQASGRGVPMMGVSAGSIVLGAWWADWSDEDGDDSQEGLLARTGLVACVGAVRGHVFDTHNEEDDWDELRLVKKLCERRAERARFLGIPTDGALVFHGDGVMEVVGAAPFRLD
jgi:peptidase E